MTALVVTAIVAYIVGGMVGFFMAAVFTSMAIRREARRAWDLGYAQGMTDQQAAFDLTHDQPPPARERN